MRLTKDDPGMTTAYITHPRYVEHDMPLHPEHAGRVEVVWNLMRTSGVIDRLHVLDAPEASDDAIRAVHSPSYLYTLEQLALFQHTVRLDPDTYANPDSYIIARLSAGGVVRAVEAVLSGEAHNALAVVRPPGHHAEANRAMGFCLLSNVAIAARAARDTWGVKRVLIVDYDVHHGNGTQAIFYDDPSVLFISSHQHNLFPGTGAIDDAGVGAGEGTTINIPLPGGCGDAQYRALFDAIITPAARRYQPELILVSVGHDAHWTDPLAAMRLTLHGYADLAAHMIALANELCGGRIAFVMEGGYNLGALAHGMVNIARLLIGDTAQDPLGTPRDGVREADISQVIERVRARHGL
jgi:acetoin utilization deacetylase AcuC-like enzyme